MLPSLQFSLFIILPILLKGIYQSIEYSYNIGWAFIGVNRLTCQHYEHEKSFFSDKHICKASFDERKIDDNHSKKFCLTQEEWHCSAKYKDCPYYK